MRPCTVWNHPKRGEIAAALLDERPIRAIAEPSIAGVACMLPLLSTGEMAARDSRGTPGSCARDTCDPALAESRPSLPWTKTMGRLVSFVSICFDCPKTPISREFNRLRRIPPRFVSKKNLFGTRSAR